MKKRFSFKNFIVAVVIYSLAAWVIQLISGQIELAGWVWSLILAGLVIETFNKIKQKIFFHKDASFNIWYLLWGVVHGFSYWLMTEFFLKNFNVLDGVAQLLVVGLGIAVISRIVGELNFDKQSMFIFVIILLGVIFFFEQDGLNLGIVGPTPPPPKVPEVINDQTMLEAWGEYHQQVIKPEGYTQGETLGPARFYGLWKNEDSFTGVPTYLFFEDGVNGKLVNSKSSFRFRYEVVNGEIVRFIEDGSGRSKIDSNIKKFIGESGEENKEYVFMSGSELIINGKSWIKMTDSLAVIQEKVI